MLFKFLSDIYSRSTLKFLHLQIHIAIFEAFLENLEFLILKKLSNV